MLETPVLFLIFNRPDTTRRVFELIKKQKPKRLYISADGARPDKPGELEKCLETRNIANEIDWDCEVKTLFRSQNLGCKKAVSEGISWFFQNEEEGIILEDDCLVSESFFQFASILLEKYRHDERIMHISAENPLNQEFGEASYYFSLIPHIWGWASWRRAWQKYSVDLENLEYFIENNLIENIFSAAEAQKYWNRIFLRVREARINTWDYQWTYALFVNNGLSINPNKNMVSNIGFGGEQATHTSENAKCANRKIFETNYSSEIRHPVFLISNKKAADEILKERYDIHPKTPLFVIKREISRFLRKKGTRSLNNI